jgi:hypothetical protein
VAAKSDNVRARQPSWMTGTFPTPSEPQRGNETTNPASDAANGTCRDQQLARTTVLPGKLVIKDARLLTRSCGQPESRLQSDVAQKGNHMTYPTYTQPGLYTTTASPALRYCTREILLRCGFRFVRGLALGGSWIFGTHRSHDIYLAFGLSHPSYRDLRPYIAIWIQHHDLSARPIRAAANNRRPDRHSGLHDTSEL